MAEALDRKLLLNLRGDAKLILDCAFGGVREIGKRMLEAIDEELSKPVERAAVSMDLSVVTTVQLLDELKVRLREVRERNNVCFQCGKAPVRARGLCKKCYKKAYVAGAIKVHVELDKPVK